MDLLTTDEAAVFMHVPLPTLRTWIAKGTAPRSARFGKRRMFLKSDLEQFVLDKFTSADDAA